jgi:cytochrome c oxidase subunit 1
MSTHVEPGKGGPPRPPAPAGPPSLTEPAAPRVNYLNVAYGVKSWLLTTDHKRIALLYLASVTLMFFLGGAFAVLIRLELVTPAGDLVQAETYNKLFTMHGVIMVFFFLIPAIPAVLGNFLIPIMIGARDLAFPRLNLASWYVMLASALVFALVRGGVDGPDLLHAILDSTRTRTSSRPASPRSWRGSRPSSPASTSS